MNRIWPILLVLALVWGCSNGDKGSTNNMADGKGSSASKQTSTGEFDKAGFVTATDKKNPKWLWVFREGSKELEEFRKKGEPAKCITRVGAGPNRLTLRGPDAETLDAYLAAK